MEEIDSCLKFLESNLSFLGIVDIISDDIVFGSFPQWLSFGRLFPWYIPSSCHMFRPLVGLFF